MTLAAPAVEGLRTSYAQILARYLAEPDETALADAYALGRRALTEGVGLIEWAAVHDETVAVLNLAGADPVALVRAGTFFRESLSPYEMTQRGYVEANSWLARLNVDLRREIAEKELLAERLAEANQELEAFSYSVAHDLRAPLRYIGGFSRRLVEDHGERLAPEARHLLLRVEHGVQRMTDLIDGLLTISRAARGELRRLPIDLASSARAILSRFHQVEPSRNVALTVPQSIPAEGDPSLVDALLENLLANAWKFTSKKQRAHIEVGIDTEAAPRVYFVRDDGAGFDMAYADRLFGVFQRLHSRESFPGTGIGLATVQRIVRRHGGRVWAESHVGRGAVFYFTLEQLAR